jgi:cytochrome c
MTSGKQAPRLWLRATSKTVVILSGAKDLLLVCAVLILTACSPDQERREVMAVTDGDPARGRLMLRKYGCQACHTIPGVVGTDATVGPPLAGIASRTYIGGVIPNAPANMVRWIEDPKQIDSMSAMPNVGVTRSDARHIAAYLYTLR